MEFGAGECGKADLAGIGKKEIVETQLHSPKVLKDMFLRAAEKAGNVVYFLRTFRIVGFNQTHMRMSITVLDCPSGYVCRMRTSDEYEFPANASSFSSGVLPILSLTLKANIIVQQSINVLNKHENSRGAADTGFKFKDTLKIPPSFTIANKRPKSNVPASSSTS